ncbi:50S ribosomal protein L2 chloroplastic, partial [Bienertia sinuspersici]
MGPIMGHTMHYRRMIIMLQSSYSIPPLRKKKLQSKYLIAWRYIYTKLLPRAHAMGPQRHCGKGRNARGIITARHRGGGHKRLYRKIDFRQNEKDIYGRIVTIEYDPNRNAYICLIHYGDGEKRYILHPRGAIIGDTIVSGTEVPIKMGNALPLTDMPLGTAIHNIEITLGKGGQLARAAGAVAKLIVKEGKSTTLKLPSREVCLISKNCSAIVGQVGNVA